MKITIIGLNDHTLRLSTNLMQNHQVELVSVENSFNNQDLRENLSSTRINLTSSIRESIKDSEIIFIGEDKSDYEIDDLRSVYDVLTRIDDELDAPQNKLIVITRLLPVGAIKAFKSYSSKKKYKFKFSYLPTITRNKLIIGVNQEEDANLIRETLSHLNKELQFVSPEMSEYYWLVSESARIVENSFVTQVVKGAEGLGLNKNKMSELITEYHSSLGFLCKKSKAIAQLSKTLNSVGVNVSVIQAAKDQNDSSQNKVLFDILSNYSSINNLKIGFILGHNKRFNNIMHNIEKMGAEIHTYSTKKQRDTVSHKSHDSINDLIKTCKDIVIFDIIDAKQFNLHNKNVYDPFNNLSKPQIKTTSSYK